MLTDLCQMLCSKWHLQLLRVSGFSHFSLFPHNYRHAGFYHLILGPLQQCIGLTSQSYQFATQIHRSPPAKFLPQIATSSCQFLCPKTFLQIPTNEKTQSGTAHYYNPQPSCYCLCSVSTWSFPSTWNALPHLLRQTKSQSFLISPTGPSAKVLQALLGSMKYRRKGWLQKAKQNPGTNPHPGTYVLVCVNLSK